MRHCDFLVFNAKCVGIAGFRRDRFFYVRRKRISGSDFSFDADLYDGTIFSVRQIDKAGEKQSHDQKSGEKKDIHACFLHANLNSFSLPFPLFYHIKIAKEIKKM